MSRNAILEQLEARKFLSSTSPLPVISCTDAQVVSVSEATPHGTTDTTATGGVSENGSGGWFVVSRENATSAGPGINDGEGFLDRMRERITAEEGRRNDAYKDTEGNWTIGIGHLLNAEGKAELEDVTGHSADEYIPQKDTNGDGVIDGNDNAQRQLTDEEVDELFEKALQKHIDRAKADVPNLAELDPRAQEAVVDMVFNLGSLSAFNDLKSALSQTDYALAAWDAGHRNRTSDTPSRYATQVPNRAARNIALFNAAAEAAGQTPYTEPPNL